MRAAHPLPQGGGYRPLPTGRIVATATERAGGWWEVTYWLRFDRDQAITADGHRVAGGRARQHRPGCGSAPAGVA